MSSGGTPYQIFGVAFGARSKSIEEWNLNMEKMEKRLVGWKKIYLSLSCLPTYFMLRRGTETEWDDPMKWSSCLCRQPVA